MSLPPTSSRNEVRWALMNIPEVRHFAEVIVRTPNMSLEQAGELILTFERGRTAQIEDLKERLIDAEKRAVPKPFVIDGKLFTPIQ